MSTRLQKITIWIGVTSVFIFGVFLFKKHPDDYISKITINNATVVVEIADTPAEQATGLMNRTELAENSGMLFIFGGEFIAPFWMKNTYIPLDMLWISADKKVVYIQKNVRPCKETDFTQNKCPFYTPTHKAQYVLEVNSGWVDKHAVKIGDMVELIQ